jgi:hypothetical protein
MSHTITLQGLAFERVGDVATLTVGDWIHSTATTEYLTVLRLHATQDGRSGTLCIRHGRQVTGANRLTILTQETADAGHAWRATEQTANGIPGTWCDQLDDNSEWCGYSLNHTGPCRH